MNDKLIQHVLSSAIGLAKAGEHTGMSDDAMKMIEEALTLCHELTTSDEQVLHAECIIDDLKREKDNVSPGCSICASPCGNTDDYDVSRIFDSDTPENVLKKDILVSICELAYQGRMDVTDKKNICIEALCMVSFDVEAEVLKELYERCKKCLT